MLLVSAFLAFLQPLASATLQAFYSTEREARRLSGNDMWYAPKPAGKFNQSRVIVHGNHVEHWLNGVKVLEYELGTAATAELIAHSNFKNGPGYAEKKGTPILLQDHGGVVWFRDIKIRELKR